MTKPRLTRLYSSVLAHLFWTSIFSSTALAQSLAPQMNQHERTMHVLSTIAAINHANLTGNYTVLYQLAAPEFQKRNPPKRLALIFGRQRHAGLDYTPALLFSPKLLSIPTQQRSTRQRLIGVIHTSPIQLNFNFTYKWSNNRWRLIAMALNPVASQAPPVPKETRRKQGWTQKLSRLFN